MAQPPEKKIGQYAYGNYMLLQRLCFDTKINICAQTSERVNHA